MKESENKETLINTKEENTTENLIQSNNVKKNFNIMLIITLVVYVLFSVIYYKLYIISDVDIDNIIKPGSLILSVYIILNIWLSRKNKGLDYSKLIKTECLIISPIFIIASFILFIKSSDFDGINALTAIIWVPGMFAITILHYYLIPIVILILKQFNK